MNIDTIGKTAQVLSVVAGVVISVLSFNATRVKEAEARTLEAQRPFLELRQKLYVEAVKSAAVLSTPEDHTKDEVRAAKRFRELYVAELSMVEVPEVEGQMVDLAKRIDPGLVPPHSRLRTISLMRCAIRSSQLGAVDLSDHPNPANDNSSENRPPGVLPGTLTPGGGL